MRLSIRLAVVLVATALAANVASSSVSAQTLKTVQERGALNCGVSQGLIGFSIADDKGAWSGFDVDFCRAVAAAVFGDPSKVHFVPLTADERFTALHDKQIDLLSRNSTWTMGRETELGLVFAGVTDTCGMGLLLARMPWNRVSPPANQNCSARSAAMIAAPPEAATTAAPAANGAGALPKKAAVSISDS